MLKISTPVKLLLKYINTLQLLIKELDFVLIHTFVNTLPVMSMQGKTLTLRRRR